MPIAGKRPQIVNLNLHQPGFARPTNNSVIQWPAKKIREDSDDINEHKTLTTEDTGFHRVNRFRDSPLPEFPLRAFVSSVVNALAAASFLRPSAERLLRAGLRANSSRCACAQDQFASGMLARTESQAPPCL